MVRVQGMNIEILHRRKTNTFATSPLSMSQTLEAVNINGTLVALPHGTEDSRFWNMSSQRLFVCHVWMVACRDWTQTVIARNICHVARLVSSTSKASEGLSDPSVIAKNASTRRDRQAAWLDCFLKKKKRAAYALA